MNAHDILKAAAGHMQDRAATYDKPEGERSMGNTVAAFNALTGQILTEAQGWLFMLVLKAARSQQGGFRADSYEDGAAYFALYGEAAASAKPKEKPAPAPAVEARPVVEAMVPGGKPRSEFVVPAWVSQPPHSVD